MDRLDAMQVMLMAVECGSISKASRARIGDVLQQLLGAYEPTPRPVHLGCNTQNRLPLNPRAFLDFVVRSSLGWAG